MKLYGNEQVVSYRRDNLAETLINYKKKRARKILSKKIPKKNPLFSGHPPNLVNDEAATDNYSQTGNNQTHQAHNEQKIDNDHMIGQHICFLIGRAFTALYVTNVQRR